jgi:NAD+ synthase
MEYLLNLASHPNLLSYKKDEFLPILDNAKTKPIIEKFISDTVAESGAQGVVLGLSGGLDSSVVLKLCVNSLGKDKVLGLILPQKDITPQEDIFDAENLATALQIKCQKIVLDEIFSAYKKIVPTDKKANGNTLARIRMSVLYHFALVNNYLVAGTSDKSELYIGYFTKFGDGGSDLLPIASLYKTQVRHMAEFLQLPSTIISKKSSPRLWPNHEAEKEIGMQYAQLDPILHCLVDLNLTTRQTSDRLGDDMSKVEHVAKFIKASEHKRRLAKICSIALL